MADAPNEQGNAGRAILWMALTGFVLVMMIGAIFGFAAAATEGGSALSGVDIAILAALAAISGGLIYILAGLSKQLRVSDGEPLTGREKMNRNIIVGSLVAGGLGGAFIASFEILEKGPDVSPLAVLSDAPLPLAIALIMAVFWGVVMPAVAWFWHAKAIDEQEESAYRDGGYYAAYAYLMAAPTWWFLWRGGLMPEPDGRLIFVAFATIWTAVWFWKKYR